MMIQLGKIRKALFHSDNLRTQLVKRNIIGITLLKGVNVVTNFLLVPMTIGYLNPTEYGIWLTLSSVLMWGNVFDFGLGHGLRNKIAEAYAVDDLEKVKIYVSTGFVVLTLLSICLFLIFMLTNTYIEWDKLLNIDKDTGNNLSIIVLWVMFFFCIQFVVRLIDVITAANQRPMLGASIGVIGNIIIVCIIGFLTHYCKSSLLYVAIAFSSTPVLVYLLFNCILFRTRYKNISPSLKWMKISCIKDIVGLGGKFFIIQVSTILVFTSSNVIIANILGPEEVTVYNIVYKYFSVVIMCFNIVISPLWSAFTDAYVKNDIIWIKKVIDKIFKIWKLSILFIVIQLLFSDIFYKFWIGVIDVPFKLTFSMSIYTILYTFYTSYVFLINATGKMKLLTLISIFILMIFFPISYLLCKLLGLVGITLSLILVLILLLIGSYIQFCKIIARTDTGIWSK